ncbi:MAG: hypothetical protein IPL62_08335 [Caulobacteraceae bacterium]|nr:hypothetical protein [Caulobacteraceae bacterium]
MSATGIRTYLEPDLAREVARVARAQGRSGSSLIAESVRLRLASGVEAVQAKAAETQKRQLNRIETRVDKLQRDSMLMKECLLVFVRVWLEHNPPVDDALAESVAASAENRFERFLDLVEGGLQPGRSIANGALGDVISVEGEETADAEAAR